MPDRPPMTEGTVPEAPCRFCGRPKPINVRCLGCDGKSAQTVMEDALGDALVFGSGDAVDITQTAAALLRDADRVASALDDAVLSAQVQRRGMSAAILWHGLRHLADQVETAWRQAR